MKAHIVVDDLQIVPGGTTEDIFVELIKELVKRLDETNAPNYNFVMDNAPIYGRKVEALMEESRQTLVYLPRYFPFLNPIEECFSKFKNFEANLSSPPQEPLLYPVEDDGETQTCGETFASHWLYSPLAACANISRWGAVRTVLRGERTLLRSVRHAPRMPSVRRISYFTGGENFGHFRALKGAHFAQFWHGLRTAPLRPRRGRTPSGKLAPF